MSAVTRHLGFALLGSLALLSTGCHDEGTAVPAATWRPVGEFVLDDHTLEIRVLTNMRCCGKKPDPKGIPVRIFAAPLTETEVTGTDPSRACPPSVCLGIDSQDHVILLRVLRDWPFVVPTYRSDEPAPRTGGWAILKVPAETLPSGDLRLWLGSEHYVLLDELLLEPVAGQPAAPCEPGPCIDIRRPVTDD